MPPLCEVSFVIREHAGLSAITSIPGLIHHLLSVMIYPSYFLANIIARHLDGPVSVLTERAALMATPFNILVYVGLASLWWWARTKPSRYGVKAIPLILIALYWAYAIHYVLRSRNEAIASGLFT